MWRAEDSITPEPGLWHPERFVAVVEDGLLFGRLREQVCHIEATYREIGHLRDPRRRLPGFHDEVWAHAAVHVNQAYESHRVREYTFPRGNAVAAEQWPELQAQLVAAHAEKAAQLQALGLKVAEIRGLMTDVPGQVQPVLYLEARRGQRFTVRRRTGRAYRLYASTSEGEPRRNVRVGVVVVRGLLSDVREEHPPRASRRDALPGGVLVGRFEILGVSGI
ncbi:hypothetical protein [Deinococcus aquaedulcis]|uniref:hypothetical protein n=1 Tax=Deinococcus aquaedulcis TaxID=2840455 RepID=UPI001C834217|nr:hypothetical protein [Deinococcus aquaedulcis]